VTLLPEVAEDQEIQPLTKTTFVSVAMNTNSGSYVGAPKEGHLEAAWSWGASSHGATASGVPDLSKSTTPSLMSSVSLDDTCRETSMGHAQLVAASSVSLDSSASAQPSASLTDDGILSVYYIMIHYLCSLY